MDEYELLDAIQQLLQDVDTRHILASSMIDTLADAEDLEPYLAERYVGHVIKSLMTTHF